MSYEIATHQNAGAKPRTTYSHNIDNQFFVEGAAEIVSVVVMVLYALNHKITVKNIRKYATISSLQRLLKSQSLGADEKARIHYILMGFRVVDSLGESIVTPAIEEQYACFMGFMENIRIE